MKLYITRISRTQLKYSVFDIYMVNIGIVNKNSNKASLRSISVLSQKARSISSVPRSEVQYCITASTKSLQSKTDTTYIVSKRC